MNGNAFIDMADVDKHESYDPSGYIFKWNNGIYRSIYKNSHDKILRLWESGLIVELIQNGLFPETEKTNYVSADSELIFKHKKIDVITYPYEWSFNMLKDASLVTLKVNQIAMRYGYQTLDAHGFNIAFCNGKPYFIDMGSFVEVHNDFNCSSSGWRPYGEFMRSFYYPLRMWSHGDEYIARHSLYGEQMPAATYWRWKSKLARYVPQKYLSKFEILWYKYKALNTVSVSDFRLLASVSDSRERLGQRIIGFSKKWGLPFSSVNLSKLENKVKEIRSPTIPSAWADYHEGKEIDSRQHFVINAIRKYEPVSVLDMAGNAGFFSKVISEVECVKYVICADYDINAIDKLYCSLNGSNLNVFPAVMNFSISIGDSKFPTPESRYKSDMVIALAITHHLLLAQNLTISFILNRLRKFTNKYVAVEFMPLGLYSSDFGKVPKIPDWYNIEWFKGEFEKYFTLLEQKEIDTNRVIFIGEIQSQRVLLC